MSWHLFTPYLAHAFGLRYELPLPLSLFILSGGAVVLLSFFWLSRRAPELPPAVADTPAETARNFWWGLLSLIALIGLIIIGMQGSQEVAENILPTAFWLLAWVVVPLSCGLIGNWTRPVNPFAFVASTADRLRGGASRAWPASLGWWPAVILYFTSVPRSAEHELIHGCVDPQRSSEQTSAHRSGNGVVRREMTHRRKSLRCSHPVHEIQQVSWPNPAG